VELIGVCVLLNGSDLIEFARMVYAFLILFSQYLFLCFFRCLLVCIVFGHKDKFFLPIFRQLVLELAYLLVELSICGITEFKQSRVICCCNYLSHLRSIVELKYVVNVYT
jgi:hypothetical protein